jgi:uncharacterized membrane protein YgcG
MFGWFKRKKKEPEAPPPTLRPRVPSRPVLVASRRTRSTDDDSPMTNLFHPANPLNPVYTGQNDSDSGVHTSITGSSDSYSGSSCDSSSSSSDSSSSSSDSGGSCGGGSD